MGASRDMSVPLLLLALGLPAGLASMSALPAHAASATDRCDPAMVETLYVDAKGFWPFKYRRLALYLSHFDSCKTSFTYDHWLGRGGVANVDITIPWFVEVDVTYDEGLEGCVLNRVAGAPPPSRGGFCFRRSSATPFAFRPTTAEDDAV